MVPWGLKMKSGWPIWNRKGEVRGRDKQTQLLPFVPFPSQSLKVYSFSSRDAASSSCSDPAVPIGVSDGAGWFLGLLQHSQHLCPPWGSQLCCLVDKTLFHSCSLPLKAGLGLPGRTPHCWCEAVCAGWREDVCMWQWLSVPLAAFTPCGEAQRRPGVSLMRVKLCHFLHHLSRNSWRYSGRTVISWCGAPDERLRDRKEGKNNISGICPLSTPCMLPELSFKALYMCLAGSWDRSSRWAVTFCSSGGVQAPEQSRTRGPKLSRHGSGQAHSGRQQVLYKERCLCGCRLGELIQPSLLSW